jgi:hypothetical protein
MQAFLVTTATSFRFWRCRMRFLLEGELGGTPVLGGIGGCCIDEVIKRDKQKPDDLSERE